MPPLFGWIFYFKDIITGQTLGLGSFSIVKEVHGKPFVYDEDQRVCHNYAIKLVRKDLPFGTLREACDLLEKEAKLLSGLNHPKLIQY